MCSERASVKGYECVCVCVMGGWVVVLGGGGVVVNSNHPSKSLLFPLVVLSSFSPLFFICESSIILTGFIVW